MGVGRHVVGLSLLVGFAFAIFLLVTSPSRARLANALAEGERLNNELNQMVARLAGLQSANAAISVSREDIWFEVDGLSVEAAMQRAIIAVANGLQIQVVAFGAAPTDPEHAIATSAYAVELEGSWKSQVEFLAEIEQLSPRLAISELWLRRLSDDNQADGFPRVAMRLTLWGFASEAEGKP